MTVPRPLLGLLLLGLLSNSAPLTAAGSDFRLREHQLALRAPNHADLQAEINFGRDIAARVLGRIPLYQDRTVNRYVTLVGRAVALQGNRPELDYHFAVLDDEAVNAYSAPGGYIFITRGALATLKDEAELAAVLAHEIAHVNLRHIVQRFRIRGTEDGGIGALGRLLGASGDTARIAFAQAVDQAMTLLFETGFNQSDELEADAEATLMLAAAGYDPTALRRYLTRVGENPERRGKTHPTSRARLSALDRLINGQGLAGLDFPTAAERFRTHVR